MTSQSVTDNTKVVDLMFIANNKADWPFDVVEACCKHRIVDPYVFWLAEQHADNFPDYFRYIAAECSRDPLYPPEVLHQFEELAKRKDGNDALIMRLSYVYGKYAS